MPSSMHFLMTSATFTCIRFARSLTETNSVTRSFPSSRSASSCERAVLPLRVPSASVSCSARPLTGVSSIAANVRRIARRLRSDRSPCGGASSSFSSSSLRQRLRSRPACDFSGLPPGPSFSSSSSCARRIPRPWSPPWSAWPGPSPLRRGRTRRRTGLRLRLQVHLPLDGKTDLGLPLLFERREIRRSAAPAPASAGSPLLRLRSLAAVHRRLAAGTQRRLRRLAISPATADRRRPASVYGIG